MRTLTGMGGLGNAQELAELLRQMGRGPDTMLAHITPEEAQMLLESGGSGKINPQTGLPEFQPEDYTGADYGFEINEQLPDYRSQIMASEPTDYYGTTQTGYNQALEAQQAGLPLTERQQYDVSDFSGNVGFQYTGAVPGIQPLTQQQLMQQAVGAQSPAETYRLAEYAQGLRTPQEVQPGVFDQFTSGVGDRLRGLETGYREFRQEYPMLERLLTTGAASLPAILAARRARREGRGAESELRAMAQPIREQAEALRQQALSGGLTPQQARQQEARRASLRQSAAGRGATTGTQEAMIENTLTRERAGLAQTNLENAMRQLNLANTLTEAAIRARLTSDRNVNQSLQNIYTNLIRTASGTNTTGQTQPPSQPEQLLQNERLIPQPTTAGGR
jgi:hypothetical protein